MVFTHATDIPAGTVTSLKKHTGPMLVHMWASVADARPHMYQHWHACTAYRDVMHPLSPTLPGFLEQKLATREAVPTSSDVSLKSNKCRPGPRCRLLIMWPARLPCETLAGPGQCIIRAIKLGGPSAPKR